MKVTLDGREVYMDPGQLPTITLAVQDPLDPGRILGTRSGSFILPADMAALSSAGPLAMSEVTPEAKVITFGEAGVEYIRANVLPFEASEDGYRLAGVSGNASWIDLARKTRLRDLLLGESEVITWTYIKASWIDEDALLNFPLINYGQLLDTDNEGTNIPAKYLRPALRVHRVLDNFFNSIGYTLVPEKKIRRQWKKFLIPNTNEIKIGAQYLDGNRLTLDQTTLTPLVIQQTGPPPLPQPTELPRTFTATDPGGNLTNTYFFTAPLDMRVRVVVSFHVTGFDLATYGSTWYAQCFRNADNVPLGQVQTTVIGSFPSWLLVDHVLGEFNLIAGTEIGVGILAVNPPIAASLISCKVEFIPVNVEYQLGLTVDIASGAPDISVMDVLSSIGINKCLIFDTNDMQGTVRVRHADDKFLPYALASKDLTDRIDHPIVRLNKPRPRKLIFRWKKDNADNLVKLLDDVIGERTYGGYIHKVNGGVDDDRVMELSFAATAMQFALQGAVYIPCMGEEDQTPGEALYEWDPRLLISDGVVHGSVTIEGEQLSEYPNVYFMRPGEPFTLPFGEEVFSGTPFPGTIAAHYTNYLYRLDNSKFMRAAVRLFDDEMLDLDLGVPVMIHDGHEPGWYYFTEVKKRYGEEGFEECELIQC